MTHKPSEIEAAHFFSSLYIIDAICFNEWFLFHVITERHYLL